MLLEGGNRVLTRRTRHHMSLSRLGLLYELGRFLLCLLVLHKLLVQFLLEGRRRCIIHIVLLHRVIELSLHGERIVQQLGEHLPDLGTDAFRGSRRVFARYPFKIHEDR
jgi:hypothetical protein